MSAEVIESSRGIHVSCRSCGLHEPADGVPDAEAIADLHNVAEHGG